MKNAVLELGGSDPFIVLEDADLDFAIAQACAGRMLCMGQVCAAPKRFIVVGQKRGERFLEGVRQQFRSLQAGDPMDRRTSIAPLSSEGALEGVLEQISRAGSHGATVVLGGKRLDRPGFHLEPTIITDFSPENPIYQEELFGPVAMMFSVDTDDAVIALANATKSGRSAHKLIWNLQLSTDFPSFRPSKDLQHRCNERMRWEILSSLFGGSPP